jgi:hypothetical protein
VLKQTALTGSLDEKQKPWHQTNCIYCFSCMLNNIITQKEVIPKMINHQTCQKLKPCWHWTKFYLQITTKRN